MASYPRANRVTLAAPSPPRKAHPLTYAELGFRNLKALATEAGLTVTS